MAVVLEAIKVAAPPALLLGGIALALALLNLAPSRFQARGLQVYASVEEAEQALGTQLLLPGYFPDYLDWPAMRIEARLSPTVQADLTFADRASGQPSLWVHQEVSERQEWDQKLPQATTIAARSSVEVNGAPAWLVVRRDARGAEYRQLYWRQDGRLLSLTTTYPQGELERMARTMAP